MYRPGRSIVLLFKNMLCVIFAAPSIHVLVVLSVPLIDFVSLSMMPALMVAMMFVLLMLVLLNIPKIPPCSSISIYLFSCAPPVYPVYSPNVFSILLILVVAPAKPAIRVFD